MNIKKLLGNQLTKIVGLTRLKRSLQSLYLGDNKFQEAPEGIDELLELVNLDVSLI